ncbi:segregation and condensation protein A [Vulgatibacter incomptus]|uniref:Segregation and condensation protein A n=1 Tax=Vulgatibacter incomptus TaxID=1391653 RepID=A0A0K1PAJ6_9BACT|nr:segregation/condensation protein A [Vulgatibacter incomptus]AKU90540.1 Segregation and condensation protein A [Vulgatibacter incomptus]
MEEAVAPKRGRGAKAAANAVDGADPSAEFVAASRAFTLKLPSFEGPLDLLLHLIREHKLDVFDIPIAFVTEEYLKYLTQMRELNLDIAGEFLVMAATLAHIKSRLLLPKPETPTEEGEEDPGDPRADLVRRLLEYQKYRAAAEDLARQDLLGRNVFTRQVRPEAVEVPEGELGLREVSVIKLIEALDRVLKNLKPEKQHQVTLERVSIGDAIGRLADLLRDREQIQFFELFDGMTERHQVIATFLGLLEMVRLKLVRVIQEDREGDIAIVRTGALGDEGIDVRDDFR